MRILVLTQWFFPEPNFKMFSFAKELIKHGHEVQVLTGFPNYPDGKIYDGYKIRILYREVIEGIHILRVPLYPSHDTSVVRRIANYASFAFSAMCMGAFLVKPADVMYVYHQPVTVGLPAIVLRLTRRIPIIYDIQDLWPDTLGATGMVNNKKILWLVDKWCRFTYNHANRITVLSPGFKKILISRGVSQEKIEVVYNWCDDSQIQSANKNTALARELGMESRFNIVFAGTMGRAQALDAVLDAAKIVGDRFPSIQFVFVGGGVDVDRLIQKARTMGIRNVLFLAKRPLSEIGKILNLADVLLVHLKDDPLFSITIPSKTQAYLSVGRPILMAVRGDAADLIERAGAGLSCIPENPNSIAQMVVKFFTMSREELDVMGDNGKKFYEQELSLSVGVRRFEEIFKSVISDNS